MRSLSVFLKKAVAFCKKQPKRNTQKIWVTSFLYVTIDLLRYVNVASVYVSCSSALRASDYVNPGYAKASPGENYVGPRYAKSFAGQAGRRASKQAPWTDPGHVSDRLKKISRLHSHVNGKHIKFVFNAQRSYFGATGTITNISMRSSGIKSLKFSTPMPHSKPFNTSFTVRFSR